MFYQRLGDVTFDESLLSGGGGGALLSDSKICL